ALPGGGALGGAGAPGVCPAGGRGEGLRHPRGPLERPGLGEHGHVTDRIHRVRGGAFGLGAGSHPAADLFYQPDDHRQCQHLGGQMDRGNLAEAQPGGT
ncbi:unnamed protein product, partial [Effrenium voratum]